MVENVLQDLANTSDLKYISLRYFNIAGADPDGQLGQSYKENSHLITHALKTATGKFEKLPVYGTDYNTPDGTCIRDYIHVTDLAKAHIYALYYLTNAKAYKTDNDRVMNCGYGHGFSVKEVITMTNKVTGIDFKVEGSARRLGDAPSIVANSEKLKKILTGRLNTMIWNI